MKTEGKPIANATDDDIIEYFEERLAVMVICGEADERKALHHAFGEVRRRYGSGRLPSHIQSKMREGIK